jgi:hypothetical protein
MTVYTAIVIYANFKSAKTHISRETDTMDSLCGKNLGFDYGIGTITGFENDESKKFTKEEILQVKTLCKKCKQALMKL